MFLSKTLILITLGFIQLASDPNAEELLVHNLLEFEELDQTYCARFSGTNSRITDESLKVLEIRGISARSEKGLQVRCYGTQGSRLSSRLEIEVHPTFSWHDALRDRHGLRKRFKQGNAAQIARGLADVTFEDEDSEKAKTFWPFPEINPFGMVFGSEFRKSGRNSEFLDVRNQLTEMEFQNSRLLKNGNTEGEWLSSNKVVRTTIEFDRKHKNLPIVVKSVNVQGKNIIGLARTTWVKYEKDSLVPETISVITERPDGSTTVQIDMKWEWVPLDRWRKWSDENFEGLFDAEKVKDFRTPFLVLFEPEKR